MSMSISSALNSSLTSLNVAQEQINVISNNIANASTAGYVDQELQTSEIVGNGVGSGVMADPIQQLTNTAASASANQATAAQSYSQEMVNILTNYTNVLGQASDSTSLPSTISALGSALTTLSTSPSDATAQSQAVTAAQNVVASFNTLDSAVGSAREQADQNISSSVQAVNSTLTHLAQNQTEMQAAAAAGGSTASYEDTQNQLIASLNQYLPVTASQNGNNGIIVTTDEGTTLFDGTPDLLSFTPTTNIPSNMRLDPNTSLGQIGGLSNVTVNGQPIQMSQNGNIAADLQLRDVTLPGFSDQLDSLAGNMIQAFQTADPTVTSTDPTGLFTDGGAALPSGTDMPQAGLAANIQLNAAVNPAEGGNVALIQAGMNGTVSSTTAGDNSTILDYIQALQTPGIYTAGTGLSSSLSVTDAASQIAGQQQSTLSTWTNLNTDRTTQAQNAATALSNATGVNVDDQMEKLLTIQQTYAASAQVIQAASTMLNTLIQAV